VGWPVAGGSLNGTCRRGAQDRPSLSSIGADGPSAAPALASVPSTSSRPVDSQEAILPLACLACPSGEREQHGCVDGMDVWTGWVSQVRAAATGPFPSTQTTDRDVHANAFYIQYASAKHRALCSLFPFCAFLFPAQGNAVDAECEHTHGRWNNLPFPMPSSPPWYCRHKLNRIEIAFSSERSKTGAGTLPAGPRGAGPERSVKGTSPVRSIRGSHGLESSRWGIGVEFSPRAQVCLSLAEADLDPPKQSPLHD
jgi:hypothetical protein